MSRLVKLHPDVDVVVTGGTGWLGQCVLHLLDSTLGFSLPNRVELFGRREVDVVLPSGTILKQKLLREHKISTERPLLVFHCAYLTKDQVGKYPPEIYNAINKEIRAAVFDLIKGRSVKGIFLPSSGAVYKTGTRELTRDAAGNPYGLYKAEDERYFAEVADKLKASICIPRVFNLSGPYINKVSTYALSSFIKSTLDRQPIRIRSRVPVYRSYIHAFDLIELSFRILHRSEAPKTYSFDTVGEETVELLDLALRIVKTLCAGTDIERDPMQGLPDVYVGDKAAFQLLLERNSLKLVDLDQQIRQTAAYLAALPSEKSS